MNRWLFLLNRLRSQVWARASVYAAFGCLAALAAVFLGPWVPDSVAERLGGRSVEAILDILASSLLAVATFSLGAMVSAYTAMSQSATPRVAALITADEGTQKSLSTFVGAFLYAVVATTAVNANYYGAEGRAVLFLTSLVVVGLVAYRLLAWISRLSSLARLSHMIELVETRIARALERHPATPTSPIEPLAGATVCAGRSGYVQNVDLKALEEQAARADLNIEILRVTGSFVRQGEPLCRVDRDSLDPPLADRVRAAFLMDRSRVFEQDPRHGLNVLGEIGARALSPAVNDPGTAVELTGVAVRILDDWTRRDTAPAMKALRACPRVREPALDPADLLGDVYGPIIRYGSSDLTVAIRIQKALRSLGRRDTILAQAARALAQDAAERAREDLPEMDRRAFDAAFDGPPEPPRVST